MQLELNYLLTLARFQFLNVLVTGIAGIVVVGLYESLGFKAVVGSSTKLEALDLVGLNYQPKSRVLGLHVMVLEYVSFWLLQLNDGTVKGEEATEVW